MTTKDVLLEGHHELCRNHAKSSNQGQCPESETIRLEGQWMWQRVKALTNVKIWSFKLFLKMTRDNVVRSPSASGETSKKRTSSLSRSIKIEKPWSFHNLGPETDFQTPNSRVNDCVKEHTSTKCHEKKKLVNTLTGSSARLQLPDLSFKVNEGWHYRNFNIYLQYLWAKNLYCNLLIVANASMDSAKWAIPNKFPYGWYRYEISRTDGGSKTEGSGECVSEACIFIIGVGKFLEHRIKFKLLQPEGEWREECWWEWTIPLLI